MAEMPVLDVRFTAEGVETVVEMIAYLKHENDALLQALSHVQTVSTQQVERIRSLEAELARLKEMT